MNMVNMMKTVLAAKELNYFEIGGHSLYIKMDECCINVCSDSENQQLRYKCHVCTGIPEAKKTEAYCLVNRCNMSSVFKCYLDYAGDLNMGWIVDLRFVEMSESNFLSSLFSMNQAVRALLDSLKRLRIGSVGHSESYGDPCVTHTGPNRQNPLIASLLRAAESGSDIKHDGTVGKHRSQDSFFSHHQSEIYVFPDMMMGQ